MCVFGAVLVVLGGVLAMRSALLLLGRGRPRRGPKPAFVIAGPYRRMRNPFLAGALVAATGVAIAFGSPWLVVATIVLALAAHVWVVRIEEPRLTARFGDAYGVYLRKVPRWMPGLSSADDQLEL